MASPFCSGSSQTQSQKQKQKQDESSNHLSFATAEILEDIKSYSSLLARREELDRFHRGDFDRNRSPTGWDLWVKRNYPKKRLNKKGKFQEKVDLCVRGNEEEGELRVVKTRDLGVRDGGRVVVVNFACEDGGEREKGRGGAEVFIEEDIRKRRKLGKGDKENVVGYLWRRFREIREDDSADRRDSKPMNLEFPLADNASESESEPMRKEFTPTNSAGRRDSKPTKVDIPLAEHLGNILKLLRLCNSSTTTSELDIARDRLRTYVVATSHRKILHRINLGRQHFTRGKRDFFDILTPSPQDTKDISEEEWLNTSTIPNEPTLQKLYTKSQIKCVQSLAKYTGQSHLVDRNIEKHPVYDRRGRKILHIMLSLYLGDLVKSLKTLETEMDLWKEGRRGMLDLKSMRRVVGDAEWQFWNLGYFVRKFEGVLGWHLKWLEGFRKRRKGGGGNGVAAGDCSVDEDDEEGKELDEMAWVDGALEYLRNICRHEFAIVGETNWHPGKRSRGMKKRERDFIHTATFALVDIRQPKVHQERTKSFNDCLDELVKDDTGLADIQSNLQKIFSRTCEKGFCEISPQLGKDKKFSGRVHYDAVMGSLFMLVSRKDLWEKMTLGKLKKLGISANTKAEVRRVLKDLGLYVDAIALKKQKCCPACDEVCKAAAAAHRSSRRNSGKQSNSQSFLPAARHKAVALPPFTSTEVAEAPLGNLQNAAKDELNKLLHNAQVAQDITESVSSHPLSSDRPDDDEDPPREYAVYTKPTRPVSPIKIFSNLPMAPTAPPELSLPGPSMPQKSFSRPSPKQAKDQSSSASGTSSPPFKAIALPPFTPQ
ncbi:unnamed protein product [Cercospora beticola]|nr:unnamed protein product [Cercospora beticola]